MRCKKKLAIAVFAFGSALVYCYDHDLYMTPTNYVQEEWNVPKYGHQYRT